MDISCRCNRQIDSSLYTLLRSGREGVDGGSAGQNMIPYGPRLKTTTTAWRSRMSNLNEMFYEARSRVRVGSIPRSGQANIYYLGWTDDVDNPDPEVQSYPTVREFEEASLVALGLVIGKICPRNATEPPVALPPYSEAPVVVEGLQQGSGGLSGENFDPHFTGRVGGLRSGKVRAAKAKRVKIGGRMMAWSVYRKELAQKKQGSLL